MKNSLIPIEKISIFQKLKNFFKLTFLHKNKTEPHLEECNNITANIKKNNINTFTENLKTNIDSKEFKLKQFTKEIENNPSLIVSLSNARLDKLISYYERITSEKQNKIEKLKISLNNEV